MARSRRYTVRLARVREGKTNYKNRLKILSSKKTRLVVRKKTNLLIAQLINYNASGDNVLLTFSTKDLKNLGWDYHLNNIPAAYLLGYLVGTKSKDVKEVIFDIGLHTSIRGSSLYAVLKGAIDAGLNISVNEEILPSQERVSGKHIADYAAKISGSEVYNRQFSKYVKNNIKPEEITKRFEEVKNKIGAK